MSEWTSWFLSVVSHQARRQMWSRFTGRKAAYFLGGGLLSIVAFKKARKILFFAHTSGLLVFLFWDVCFPDLSHQGLPSCIITLKFGFKNTKAIFKHFSPHLEPCREPVESIIGQVCKAACWLKRGDCKDDWRNALSCAVKDGSSCFPGRYGASEAGSGCGPT